MKDMRNDMPTISGIVDDLRRQYGLLPIDRQIRRAMRGEPTFFAKENGHTIGTPSKRGTVEIYSDDRGVSQTRPVVIPATYIEFTLPEGKPTRGK
jgi:hypothetical protein